MPGKAGHSDKVNRRRWGMTILYKPLSWDKFFRPPLRGTEWAEKKYAAHLLHIQQGDAQLYCDEFAKTEEGIALSKKMVADGMKMRLTLRKEGIFV
jgi:hypothetical protein